jgi:hypothetical protein
MREASEAGREAELERRVELLFAPIHKRCLGVAVGSVAALGLFLVTLVHMLRSPDAGYPLELLSQYFVGYSVSFSGAFVGLAWGFLVGFVAGWFLAFARNTVLGAFKLFFRSRAELAQTRGFLDHI